MTKLTLAIEARALSWPGRSGIRRVAESVISELVHHDSEVSLIVIVRDGKGSCQMDLGCRTIVVGGGAFSYLAWRVDRVARAYGADVLVCIGPGAPRTSLPTIAIVHDVYPLRYGTFLPRRYRWSATGLRTRIATRLVLFSLRWCNSVLVPSYTTQRDLTRVWDPKSARMSVTRWGAYTGIVSMTGGDPVDSRVLMGTVAKYFLYVGNVNWAKGINELVAAYRKVRKRVEPSPELLIVGRPNWPRVADEVVSRVPGVRWIREADDDELARLYRGAVAMVAPSYYEGFGLPVVEAMASGCPVIASDVSVYRELLGPAGYFVPVGTVDPLAMAMVDVIQDCERRASMRALGEVRAANYTWDCVAARLISEASLLAGAGGDE